MADQKRTHSVSVDLGDGTHMRVCGIRGELSEKDVEALKAIGRAAQKAQLEHVSLPLHRAGDAATTARCSTCDGGGCLDCTDPA